MAELESNRTQLEQLVVLVRQGIGGFLRPKSEPITFWLGAGASVSSGGPSTWAAEQALTQQAGGRGAVGGGITAQFDQWNPAEKRQALAPLFEHLVPYLGYRLLASLGRTRKIRVINLNWDAAVEKACALLGVVCHSFDLNALTDADRVMCVDESPGVVVAHVHGTLDGDPRYALLTTLKFGLEQEELLRTSFLPHTTITIGARFEGDTDVTNFLEQQASHTGTQPVFVFARGPMYQPGHNIPKWMAARDSSNNIRLNDAVDFDRIMLELVQSLHGRYFEQTAKLCPALDAPGPADLVMPHPETFRDRLDDPVLLMIGSPQKGKTTTAALLIHVASLTGIDPSRAIGYEPRFAIGGNEAATIMTAPRRGPVMIDDPFGALEDEYRSNTAVYKELRTMVADGGWCPTIVASRRSPWLIAADRDAAANSAPLADPFIAVDVDAAPLFNSGNLKLVLHPEEKAIAAAIDSSTITTPNEIFLRRNGLPMGGEAGTDAIDALRQRHAVAVLVGLSRLQYLTDKPKTLAELTELTKRVNPTFGADPEHSWAWALRAFALDGRRFVRPRHSVYIEAVDFLLNDPSSDLSKSITILREAAPWLSEAMDIHSIALGGVDELEPLLETLEPAQRSEWLPSLVASHPGKVLRLIQDRWYAELDRWGLCELALNLLAAWPGPSHSASLAMVRRMIDDRQREGTYAILEAVCYLGPLTPPAIRDRILTAMWDLLAPDVNRLGEAAKCYDALLWKSTALPAAEDWQAEFLRAAENEPEVQGAVLAAHAYHDSSVDVLKSTGQPDRLASPALQLTADEVRGAVQMIRWHYAHNARSSAIMLRHERVDLDALRRRAPTGGHDSDTRSGHFLDALIKHEIARGWAAVAALQMAANTPGNGYNTWAVQAITQATDDDEGLIAAMVSFELTGPLVAACASRARKEIREPFLNALSSGLPANANTGLIELPGSIEELTPPRFRILRDGPHQLRTLGITFPQLETAGVRFSRDPQLVLRELESSRAAASARFGAEIIDRIIESVACGDARPLAAAVNARTASTPGTGSGPQVGWLLEQAAALLTPPPDAEPTLFP